jgi:hypothetical protein
VLLRRPPHDPPPGGVGRGPRTARAEDLVPQLAVEPLVRGPAGPRVAGAEAGVALDPAQDRAAVHAQPGGDGVQGQPLGHQPLGLLGPRLGQLAARAARIAPASRARAYVSRNTLSGGTADTDARIAPAPRPRVPVPGSPSSLLPARPIATTSRARASAEIRSPGVAPAPGFTHEPGWR